MKQATSFGQCSSLRGLPACRTDHRPGHKLRRCVPGQDPLSPLTRTPADACDREKDPARSVSCVSHNAPEWGTRGCAHETGSDLLVAPRSARRPSPVPATPGVYAWFFKTLPDPRDRHDRLRLRRRDAAPLRAGSRPSRRRRTSPGRAASRSDHASDTTTPATRRARPCGSPSAACSRTRSGRSCVASEAARD